MGSDRLLHDGPSADHRNAENTWTIGGSTILNILIITKFIKIKLIRLKYIFNYAYFVMNNFVKKYQTIIELTIEQILMSYVLKILRQ